jgi:hypothetical protein
MANLDGEGGRWDDFEIALEVYMYICVCVYVCIYVGVYMCICVLIKPPYSLLPPLYSLMSNV